MRAIYLASLLSMIVFLPSMVNSHGIPGAHSEGYIADVLVGDKEKISLTAYDPTRYGRLDGIVEKVSADAITDQQDGRTYYSVKISISSTLFEKDSSEVILLPGMVATIDVLAGKRTVLDYIWQPIARTKDRALRD